MTVEVDDGPPCEVCGHPFHPHILLATTGDPGDGGVIICNVRGCECLATWGMDSQRQTIAVPNPETLNELRRHMQQ